MEHHCWDKQNTSITCLADRMVDSIIFFRVFWFGPVNIPNMRVITCYYLSLTRMLFGQIWLIPVLTLLHSEWPKLYGVLANSECSRINKYENFLFHSPMMENHVTFCTYIGTERVRKLIIISLILNEFSCGKVQILCRSSSKSLGKSCFHARCIFPHKLEQCMKVFAGICVEKYSA